MDTRHLPFVFASFLALPFGLSAQPATKSSAPVNATVGEVTDTRTTGSFSAECKIELKFTGDAAADAQSIHQVHIRKAIDDLGRNLVPADDSPAFRSGFSSSVSAQQHNVLKTELRLRNPSRNSATIKLLEGDVEFFSPTTANGGILVIRNVLKQPAEPIQDPALKSLGVDVIYLTKESYEAKRRELASAQGGGAMQEAFGQLFNGMFSGMFSSSSKNALTLYVGDKNNRVVQLEFEDAFGKPLSQSGSFSMNGLHTFDLRSPAPPDAQLRVLLATPSSIQMVPFRLENIALP